MVAKVYTQVFHVTGPAQSSLSRHLQAAGCCSTSLGLCTLYCRSCCIYSKLTMRCIHHQLSTKQTEPPSWLDFIPAVFVRRREKIHSQAMYAVWFFAVVLFLRIGDFSYFTGANVCDLGWLTVCWELIFSNLICTNFLRSVGTFLQIEPTKGSCHTLILPGKGVSTGQFSSGSL